MIRPIYKGFLRPNLSSRGPYKSCPTEIPIKKPDSDKETFATVVCRSFAMAGNPGRYISMEKGPSAVSDPNNKIRKKCFLLVMVISIGNYKFGRFLFFGRFLYYSCSIRSRTNCIAFATTALGSWLNWKFTRLARIALTDNAL
jgi:hypothetical protein